MLDEGPAGEHQGGAASLLGEGVPAEAQEGEVSRHGEAEEVGIQTSQGRQEDSGAGGHDYNARRFRVWRQLLRITKVV